jgi:hypothetical protein
VARLIARYTRALFRAKEMPELPMPPLAVRTEMIRGPIEALVSLGD